MNVGLIAIIGGVLLLSKLSSKAKALDSLEIIFTKFAIAKRPIWEYFQTGLPINIEAAAINETQEPLRFNAFNGSFRLGDSGLWNPLRFVPENGIGIPANGGGLIKFSVQVPTESVFNAIDQLASGTLKAEVQIKGEVLTNTLKIPVDQTIPLITNEA